MKISMPRIRIPVYTVYRVIDRPRADFVTTLYASFLFIAICFVSSLRTWSQLGMVKLHLSFICMEKREI